MSPASSAARLSPYFGVILFAAIFFAPELFGGRIAATANMARWRPWLEYATPEQRRAASHNPDCNLSYYPRRALLHQAWRDGELPRWNPYSFCGTPFLADVQAGVFYPVNWLLLPFDPGKQLGYFLFLHVAWGALGVVFLLRREGLPVAIAFLCGCVFALNGYFAKHFGQPTFLAAAAWIPWVILLALGVLRAPGARRAALLALAGACLFLAGQPQTAIHAGYAVLIVLVMSYFASPRSDRPSRPGRAIAFLCTAAGLAALLVGAQLLPTLELASSSARSVLPYSTVVSGAFHPVDAIRFIVPEFFGSPLTSDEWSFLFARGDGFYLRNQLNSIFAGTPIFVLALWGMTCRRTRRAALPFTALFVLSVLVAFGTPLANAVYELLPGFRFSRIDRLGALVIFAQIPPAALAARDLLRGGRSRRVLGALVLFLALAILGIVLRADPTIAGILGANPTLLPPGGLDTERVMNLVSRSRTAMLFAAGTGVAFLLPAGRVGSWLPLALAALQLFLFASPYRGDRRPEEVFAVTPEIERLRATLDSVGEGGGRFLRFGRDQPVRPYALSSVLPPSTNVPFALRDLQGYNALANRRLGETLERVLGGSLFSHGIWTGRRIVAPTRAASLEHPLLDALSVGAVIGVVPFEARGWAREPGRGFTIWRNQEALPRVRLAPRGYGVAPEQMAEILERGEFRPAHEVQWIGAETVGDPDPGHGGAYGEVEVVFESLNEIEVRTRANEDAVLVVADAYSPGWHAAIDGESAEILPVYGLVRGVIVPEGEHLVRMEYRPASLVRGVGLSVIGLLVVGLILALTRGAQQ